MRHAEGIHTSLSRFSVRRLRAGKGQSRVGSGSRRGHVTGSPARGLPPHQPNSEPARSSAPSIVREAEYVGDVLVSARVSLSDWTSVVGLGFAALAAYFAGRAIHFARKTVTDSANASKAAADRHAEQMKQMHEATQAAAQQHRVEMDDRRLVAAAEARERQLRQLATVAEMVLQVGFAARSDPRLATVPDTPVNGNAEVPSRLIALEGALGVLAALGVEEPPETVELTRVGRHAGIALQQVANMSVGALLELQRVTEEIRNDVAETAID
jgi:hypothetical protein